MTIESYSQISKLETPHTASAHCAERTQEKAGNAKN